MKLVRVYIQDILHLVESSAGVSSVFPAFVHKVDGAGSTRGHQEDDGDHDLVGPGGSRVIDLQFGLLSGLKNITLIHWPTATTMLLYNEDLIDPDQPCMT